MSSYEEPTDDELEGLLSTYAEALYKSSIIPDGDNGDDQQADGMAVVNTNQKERTMSGNSHEQAAIDVDLEPADQNNGKGRILALVGGLLVVAAVGVGAVSLLGDNDASELDVAQTQEEAVEDSAATNDVAEEPTEEVEESGESEDSAAATAESDSEVISESSSYSPFGFGNTVFANGEFATLQSNGNGFDVTFGLEDAQTTPAVGLPEGEAWANLLVATDNGFAALIEVFEPTPIDEPESFFGSGEEPERLIATSTDLINWTTAPLPSLSTEGAYAWISSIGASGDTLVLSGQLENGISPEQILVEAGVIPEEEMFNICSSSYGPGEFEAYTCDFENFNEFSDEQPEETLLIRIEEGDELYPLIEESLLATNNQPDVVMIVGTMDGGFEVVDSPLQGWESYVVGTPSGFFAYSAGDSGTSGFSSTDGITWNAVEAPGSATSWGISSLEANGETVLAISQDQEGISAWVSTDLGATWAESVIPTELFSPWGQAVAGPAGFAIDLQGATEPYDDPFLDAEPIVLTVDGYTMTIEFNTGVATLTGPDGVVIHDDVQLTGLEVENTVRFEGTFDENLIWLDAETGEDLVMFTEADFEAAYEEIFNEDALNGDFVEPDSATETWFSADGVNWTLLTSAKADFDSYSGILAVGDGEVAIFTETFVEPPAELYDFENGFEPTDEEIAALDAWHAEQGDNRVFEVISVG